MAVDRQAAAAGSSGSLLGSAAFRSIVYQVLVVGLVGLGLWYLIGTTIDNLAQRKIASGFGFLGQEAGFAIGESLIDYEARDSYGRALLVGIVNTLKVGVVGIVLATIIGTTVGVARLSSNWMVAKLASGYVETLRNIPLLLQLYFWYQIITGMWPNVREAWNPIPGLFLSSRGLSFAVPDPHPVYWVALAAFAAGIVLTFAWRIYGKRRQEATGQAFSMLWPSLGLILGLPLVVVLGALVGGAGLTLNVPELGRFNLRGGAVITPEFTALLFGLVLYTGAFIAEIVRSGILAVSKGQSEAARALGLKSGLVMRLVILPQALRVIVPPMTSQYLNLVKNSSLAIAIGYPDIVSIANTTLNQTGQAVEGVAIIMAVYLTISLSISLFMNWYNARIKLVER